MCPESGIRNKAHDVVSNAVFELPQAVGRA